MHGGEAKGLRRQEDAVDFVQFGIIEIECGVTVGAAEASFDIGPCLPVGEAEHRRDVGIARDRHPRVAPNRVEHALLGPSFARERIEPRRERFGLAIENCADEDIERSVRVMRVAGSGASINLFKRSRYLARLCLPFLAVEAPSVPVRDFTEDAAFIVHVPRRQERTPRRRIRWFQESI